MGIRYFGQPIAADHFTLATENPRYFLCCSEVHDRWRDANPELAEPFLDLDKAFGGLRWLFTPREGEVPRPALSLVTGDVTHTHRGWRPYYGVLSAREVSAVADDLRSIDFDDLAPLLLHDDRWRADDEHYLRQYFAGAVECTAVWARAGLGAIYSIG